VSRQGRWLRARSALTVLARMMDLTDPATSEHGRDVAELVPRVGRLLGIEGETLEELELAAQFHDIGKVAVPEIILRKPGPLTDTERRVMACHVEWGAELLRNLPGCAPIATIVRHHHERYDGRGYPDGLRDGQIPLASRVIAACDAYGAMVSDRPYRRALDEEVAADELRDNAGTQFDPAAVAAVLEVLGDRAQERACSPGEGVNRSVKHGGGNEATGGVKDDGPGRDERRAPRASRGAG
jgi:HD-GYP domain-containing protein (c-di-GMP phosphodiesterase class II)